MKDRVFLDTNILLYLFSEDEHEKSTVCATALKKYSCITSTQAINELCNVFTKKWKLPIEDIETAVQDIKKICDIRLVDLTIVSRALEIHKKHGYSYYDCLMLSVAIFNDCKYILSEDMKDGHIIDGLEIANIFIR